MTTESLTASEIRSRLARFDASRLGWKPVDAPDYREAGVLAPLIRQEGAWQLLFIRRSRRQGDCHSGQVAFAGGKPEAGDRDIRETALREAREEIGVHPRQLEVLGALPPWYSGTGYCITATVARLEWPCPLKLQTAEVDRVFSIPLDWLASPDQAWIEDHVRPDGRRVRVIRYREWQGEQLWGATAAMVQMLLRVLNRDFTGLVDRARG